MVPKTASARLPNNILSLISIHNNSALTSLMSLMSLTLAAVVAATHVGVSSTNALQEVSLPLLTTVAATGYLQKNILTINKINSHLVSRPATAKPKSQTSMLSPKINVKTEFIVFSVARNTALRSVRFAALTTVRVSLLGNPVLESVYFPLWLEGPRFACCDNKLAAEGVAVRLAPSVMGRERLALKRSEKSS